MIYPHTPEPDENLRLSRVLEATFDAVREYSERRVYTLHPYIEAGCFRCSQVEEAFFLPDHNSPFLVG